MELINLTLPRTTVNTVKENRLRIIETHNFPYNFVRMDAQIPNSISSSFKHIIIPSKSQESTGEISKIENDIKSSEVEI